MNLGGWIGYVQADKGAMSLGDCINNCVGIKPSDNTCNSVNYDLTNPDYDYCWFYPETGSDSGFTSGVCGHAYAVPAGVSHLSILQVQS